MTDNSIQTKRLEIALEQYERLIFSICYRMVGAGTLQWTERESVFNKDRYQQMSGFPEAEAAEGNAFRG